MAKRVTYLILDGQGVLLESHASVSLATRSALNRLREETLGRRIPVALQDPKTLVVVTGVVEPGDFTYTTFSPGYIVYPAEGPSARSFS